MKHLIILLTATIFLGACMGHGYRKDRDYSNATHNRNTEYGNNKSAVNSDDNIEILKAKKYSYQPGIVGVAGTTYSFEVYTKKEGITFGKVWLSPTKTFAVKAVDPETSLRPTSTKNKKLSFKITDPKNNNAVGEKLPVPFSGVAVIQYFVNGKVKYLNLKKVNDMGRQIYE